MTSISHNRESPFANLGHISREGTVVAMECAVRLGSKSFHVTQLVKTKDLSELANTLFNTTIGKFPKPIAQSTTTANKGDCVLRVKLIPSGSTWEKTAVVFNQPFDYLAIHNFGTRIIHLNTLWIDWPQSYEAPGWVNRPMNSLPPSRPIVS